MRHNANSLVPKESSLLSLALTAKRIGMLKRRISLSILALSISILVAVSTTRAGSHDVNVETTANSLQQSEVPASRLARLRRGINLSHWFAQSADYSKAHLESHTTAEDFALISSLGFDHVRLTL